MQQGKAISKYTPFQTDNDETCDLALEKSEEVTKSKPGRSQQVPPDPVTGYPPNRIRGASIIPQWLSCEEWLKVRALRSHGKNILEIAESVDKNASKLRLYIDTYLVAFDDESPLPSAKSTDSSTNSTAGSTETEEVFAFHHQVLVPREGMPHPSFLNRQEQEICWKMFQQHRTGRDMTERLHKNRHRLSQYINAYFRPQLLELQAKEREAENAATPTPTIPLTLAGDILQFPPYNPVNPVNPVTAASRSASLIGNTTQTPTSQLVTPVVAVSRSTSSHEPSLYGTHDAELDAFQIFYDPLLVDPPAAVTHGEVEPLGTPETASDGDSLFGGSPTDENHEGSCQVVSNQHELGPAHPTQKKRKCEGNHEEMPALRQASKRVRHRSLP